MPSVIVHLDNIMIRAAMSWLLTRLQSLCSRKGKALVKRALRILLAILLHKRTALIKLF
jgi:hypothetical protein